MEQELNPLDLLIRPSPIFGESSIGYFTRLAEVNCLLSLQNLGDLYRDEKGFIDWNMLFKAIGIEDKVANYLFGTLPQGWQLTSTFRGIPAAEYNHSYKRWCPLCLKEALYFRGVWGLKLSCVCVSHACYLLERCGRCKQAQSWHHFNLFRCLHCGVSLEQTSTQVVSPMMMTLQRALMADLIGVRSEIFSGLNTNAWLRLIRYLGQFNGVELPKRPGQISGLHHLEVAKSCLHNVAHLLSDWPNNLEKLLQDIQASLPVTSSLKKTFGVLYRVLYFHLREEKFQFLRDAFEAYLHQHWWGMVCKRNRAFKTTTIEAHPRLTLKQTAKQTGLAPSLIRHLSVTKVIDKCNIYLPSGRQVSSFHQADLPHIEALAKDMLNLQTTAQYLFVSERVVRELIAAKVIAPMAIRTHFKMANWLISKQQLQHLFLKANPKHDKDLVSFAWIVKYWRLREGEMLQLVKALISAELKVFNATNCSVAIGKAMLDKVMAKNWLCALRNLDAMSIKEAAKLLGIKQQVAYHLEKIGLIESIKTKQAGKQIPKEAVAAFNNNYIALSALAKQYQTSPSALLKRFIVKPVTGPQVDGGRQYFYLKQHFETRETGQSNPSN